MSEYTNGKAYRWLPTSRTAGKIFTSAGKINLEVAVWDENLNQDFCTVELTIIDNTPPMTRMSGSIQTKEGLGLLNAEVIPTSMSTGVMTSVMTNELEPNHVGEASSVLLVRAWQGDSGGPDM